MEIATQLALFLENQPGTLAAVCDELAKADINILALTISDTVDHSVVRMIVSDTDKAMEIFEEHGTLVVENKVLLAHIDNKPGSLSRIAHELAELGREHRVRLSRHRPRDAAGADGVARQRRREGAGRAEGITFSYRHETAAERR